MHAGNHSQDTDIENACTQLNIFMPSTVSYRNGINSSENQLPFYMKSLLVVQKLLHHVHSEVMCDSVVMCTLFCNNN